MICWRNCFRRQGIWRRIFLRSPANGAMYQGDQLPRRYWDWPKDTYLQRRLKYLEQHSYLGAAPNGLTQRSAHVKPVSSALNASLKARFYFLA
jgi:hypothetical protein